MPLGDGTGPRGKGPGTGRGMGGCGTSGARTGNGRSMPLFGGVDFEELKRIAAEKRRSETESDKKRAAGKQDRQWKD